MTEPLAEAHRRAVRAVAVASLGLVLVALPTFLVSGLAVQIREDLGFSEVMIGAIVSAAFACTALSAPVLSRIADTRGARHAIVLGAVLSVASLVGLGTVATSWWHVTLLLAMAGMAISVTDPGLTVLLSRAVPPGRQGLAFGIKEASIPLASLTAGLAIPAIAVTAGWRWALTVAVLPVVGLAALLPRVDAEPPPRRRHPTRVPSQEDADRQVTTPHPPTGLLALTALATGLGMIAASGAGIFVPQSAVAMGMTPSAAGVLLALGSGAGIVTRIGMGVVADRRGGGQFALIAVMLALGSVTMLFGTLSGAAPLTLATIGTFSVGWGWSGLLFVSLVRVMPAAPGASAGVAIAGLSGGNAIGPLVFGLVAGRVSHQAAWLNSAVLAAAAAALMAVTSHRLRRHAEGIA